MDKQKRPLGLTALAVASVAAGIYCMVAAIALLFGGTLGGVFGADGTAVVIAIGALYLGVVVAAYFVGYGFWTQRPWSWAGGIVVFGALIVTSVLLTLVSGDLVSGIVPSIAFAAAIWYLLRPATKAQLLGTDKAEKAGQPEAPAAAGALDTPQAVR
jgi:hypothetical protein